MMFPTQESQPFCFFCYFFFFFSPFGFAWQPLSTTSHCSCWCVFCPLPQLFFLLYCCCVCGNFPWHTNSIWNNSLYLSVFFFLYSSSFRSVKKKKKKSNKRELGTHTLISVWTSVANHSCWKSRGKCVWFQTKCLPLFFFLFLKTKLSFKKWTTWITMAKEVSTQNWTTTGFLFLMELKKKKMNKFHDFQVFWKSFSETAEGRKEVAQLLMTKVGRKWQLNEARWD